MPKREEYFGTASELRADELPTIRDIIRYAKFLRDNHPGKSICITDPGIGINSLLIFFGSNRSSGCHNVCVSVRPFGTKLSKAHNLHLSGSD